MPTRLLLEGGDLQELLAQVREEHGTRAKIVSAERVRAGGLTGLLRAERYELTVELSDDEPAEAPVPVGVAPGAAGSPAPPPPARAAQAVAGGQTHGTPSAAGPAQRPAARPAAPGAVPVANAAPSAGAMSGRTPTGGAVNGPAAGGAPGNGMAPIGPAGSGMTAQGAAGNGLAAYNGAAGNGMTAYGAVGNGITGNGITGNGMATHGAAGNGMAGNSGRPAAGPAGRQANAPAIGGRPAGEHGPDVDELLALLEQREAATPVSSSVGGPTAADEVPGSPPAGFDAVLAELRGAGGAAANGAAANGTANGTANATPNGMPNGAASATPDGAANATPDGVSNGTPHGGANASAGTAHGPAAGQGAPPQQAQSAHSTSPHVQSAQTPPSAIHSAIENALPAVLRQESTPVSAETVEFAMDPIFAPAKGAPEAPPAPAAARATIPAPGTTARPGAGHTQTGHTQTGHTQPGHTPNSHAPTGHAQTGHAQTGQPPAPTQTSPAQAGPAHSGAGAQNGSAHGTSAQNSASRATSARSTANPGRTRPLSPDPRRPNHFLSYGELESIPSEHPLPQKLADLGLPQRVIDRLPLGEAYPSIVRALLDEPDAPPLPSGPGTIITIIGELAGALAVAEDIARILRLDADRILIASESPQVGRHIADPGDAGRQAARLRGGDQPRLVCVDAPVPTSWVQQVVIALRPDAVWCAVDATRKPADVARQLRSLPRVDALAVHQLEATADPASPLALGVPVALLDGQPAGPHGWAALLSRRLFEEEFSGGDR